MLTEQSQLKKLYEYSIQSLDMYWFESYLFWVSGRRQYVEICHINNKNKINKEKSKLNI